MTDWPAEVDLSQEQMDGVLHCSLCNSADTGFYHRDKSREYHRCGVCDLVFVPPAFFLSAQAEKAEYDLHQNDPHDAGYQRFLGRLATPLLARLQRGATGMDFGSGAGSALPLMLARAGMEVAIYDPFYFPDRAVLEQHYDFITATEVVEHLHHPGAELAKLWQLLRPGGVLAVMTKLVINRDAFSRWHYKNDRTHVAFFSRASWNWWSQQYGAQLEFIGNDVMLLQKS